MNNNTIEIIKTSGEKAKFSLHKLRKSLKRTGADDDTINKIIDVVSDELYQGISTKQIHQRAFQMLKQKKSHFASKYKLKKAIYELGPTGFPFERFIGAVLKYSGYGVTVGKIVQGKCVTHEIDVIAQKNNTTTLVECKYHSEQGLKCNVKIPLYINSRYRDIKAIWSINRSDINKLSKVWVVTNTRFTEDALDYGKCEGLYLIGWDYPVDNALKDRIDRLNLYPITVSTLLSKNEKQIILSKGIVLCRELINDTNAFDELKISDIRKEKITKEIKLLCTN